MCWQQLPGLIVTGRSTIGADPCGLLSAPIAKLSSHSWGNTRSRSHDGLGAGIRDAWIVDKSKLISTRILTRACVLFTAEIGNWPTTGSSNYARCNLDPEYNGKLG